MHCWDMRLSQNMLNRRLCFCILTICKHNYHIWFIHFNKFYHPYQHQLFYYILLTFYGWMIHDIHDSCWYTRFCNQPYLLYAIHVTVYNRLIHAEHFIILHCSYNLSFVCTTVFGLDLPLGIQTLVPGW